MSMLTDARTHTHTHRRVCQSVCDRRIIVSVLSSLFMILRTGNKALNYTSRCPRSYLLSKIVASCCPPVKQSLLYFMVQGTSYCRYTCTHTHPYTAHPQQWDVCDGRVCIKQAERALCHLARGHFPFNVPSFLLHFTLRVSTRGYFHLACLFLWNTDF